MTPNSFITVLIVEDHLVTLDGLSSALSAQPDINLVGKAADFESGIAMAIALQPQCVLLDLHLPGSPGPKAMIRQFAASASSRIIIFSGEDRDIFIEAALNAGADAYVLKSKPASVVLDLIRGLVSPGQDTPQLHVSAEKLSSAEKDILGMLALGMKYADMADRRASSGSTVRKQCDRLQIKLNLKTREELIAWAAVNGFGNID